jgi:asparagine synthase (glutamine-hydrolysing)
LDSDYYLDNFEDATWHLETPINHPNTIGIYKLSQRAKEYVTVLLSGEGADEVFGGYQWFYDLAFPFTGRRFLHEIKLNFSNPFNLFNYFDPGYRSVMATSFITPDTGKKLYSDFSLERAVGERRELYSKQTGSTFDKQVKYEMQVYLPDLLIRQDKMSMAHSIENRVPFLDNEVVEKSFKVPEKYLLRQKGYAGSNTQKYLLKKIASNVFGQDFAFRNKMGFGIPLRDFFLKENFNEYLLDKVLPGIKSRGLFNEVLVSSWMKDVTRLKYYEVEALWIMVSFEIWASLYFKQ